MKRILLLALAVALTVGCRPQDEFGVGTTPDQLLAPKVSTLIGTWALTRVIVVDNDAVSRGFPVTSTATGTPIQRLDITNQFSFTSFRLTLNGSGGTPSTFTVTTGGAPNFLNVTSGNWSVDDPVFATRVRFGTGGSAPSYGIYRPVKGDDRVVYLRFERRNATNNIVMSYEYEFTKQ